MRSAVLLAQEHQFLPGIPAPIVGLGVFCFLVVLLLLTLAIGKGRPHV